jgi:D-glycero-D-manno-heptose 1,7-bisphosphate phosphatase
MTRGTIFIDKDGTLIEDLPYNVDPARIRLAPGSRAGIRLLGAAGYRFVVVTNQSGVERGYFTEAELRRVHDHLEAELRALGARLLGFYFCPHEPVDDEHDRYACNCRKPLPGLVERAARELGLDVEGSWFIGDTWMDVLAGRRAGCRTIMVGEEYRLAPTFTLARRPDHAVPDLLAAARVILAEDGVAVPATHTTSTTSGEAVA